MLVFAAESVKIQFIGCIMPMLTKKAKWAWIWSHGDPRGRGFLRQVHSWLLAQAWTAQDWQHQSWSAKLHTRQINLHRKMFCFGLMQIPNLYLTPFLLWVYFCSWRKFKMQVLTLMVINGLKHDVKFVNLRTKHHYWNITSVNKSFICWLPRRIKRSSNSSFKL